MELLITRLFQIKDSKTFSVTKSIAQWRAFCVDDMAFIICKNTVKEIPHLRTVSL